MVKLIGPNSPADTCPATYWDWRGRTQPTTPDRPTGLLGEYLPPLADAEVEIVMIGMYTVNGDAISIRAKRKPKTIRYHLVDEQELGYASDASPDYYYRPRRSSMPLTFKQVTDLLWSICTDYGHLFVQSWVDSAEFANGDNDEDSMFTLKSDFYTGLNDWLNEQYRNWREYQNEK